MTGVSDLPRSSDQSQTSGVEARNPLDQALPAGSLQQQPLRTWARGVLAEWVGQSIGSSKDRVANRLSLPMG